MLVDPPLGCSGMVLDFMNASNTIPEQQAPCFPPPSFFRLPPPGPLWRRGDRSPASWQAMSATLLYTPFAPPPFFSWPPASLPGPRSRRGDRSYAFGYMMSATLLYWLLFTLSQGRGCGVVTAPMPSGIRCPPPYCTVSSLVGVGVGDKCEGDVLPRRRPECLV